MKDILTNIREVRQKLGYTQDFVAQKIGMSQNWYSLIENGSRKLKYSDLNQIAIALDLSVVDIINYPDNKEKGETTIPNEVSEPPSHYGKCAVCVEKDKRIALLEKYVERLELDLGNRRKIV